MPSTTFKKGGKVAYSNGYGANYTALVRRVHRDGSLTVEPWFFVNNDNREVGPFQGGFTLRLAASHFRAWSH